MRARLYRGPHDGRVLEVPDNQTSIMLRRPKRRGLLAFGAAILSSEGSYTVIETINDEYRMVYVDDQRFRPSRLPAIHPDGSVYFEWTKKRGTRIER